jgi:serine/threonine-protein kinase
MMPGAVAVPARSRPQPKHPSGPHTISHLSIPSLPAQTERVVSTERQGSTDDASISIHIDFESSQGALTDPSPHRMDTTWESEAGAPDPSLQESVVFDPDVLARESRSMEHPAEGESYSVVFENEETKPGSGRERLMGVVVRKDDDLSLTPTVPMDVPPRRGPSFRRDPSELVSEDSETIPSEGGKQPASSGAATSSTPSRGPRTVRRSNSHGLMGAGRIIANRYRIESLVGAGAIGAVYKASHVDLPRTFAIKLLHPHYRTDQHLMTSFRTEARAASLLDHPNVTVVHDFGEEPDGLVYIVMEYLAGENLQTILDEERRLTPRRTIDIMLQVCAALSAAHDRGIVHRDVKPDNIMLVPARDDEGRAYELVKVCDFGIAALESTPDTEDDEWTAGTPEYMAPEQAGGRADQRTDVYACGIVLYEMLTGRPPFVGDSPVATLAKHAMEQARRPSEIMPGFPLPLEAIIMRAIEKAPERRFATMRELRVELKRLL